ncbi:MAG: hypothetical protein JXR64_05255 [Spirochaetales bacterium]|nr:hypothetical protein [Spirochaetales bacterium]
MNKKLSTILFILGGTLVNLLLMIIFISSLLAATSAILRGLGYEPGSSIYIPFLIGAIFGGMVLAFIVYSKITKFVQNKYNLEKYLEPLFKIKRR